MAIDEEPAANGDLAIVTEALPTGVVGREYSAVLLAEGGSPYLGKKRPAEVGIGVRKGNLRCRRRRGFLSFGAHGDAIPHPKNYLTELGEAAEEARPQVHGGRGARPVKPTMSAMARPVRVSPGTPRTPLVTLSGCRMQTSSRRSSLPQSPTSS